MFLDELRVGSTVAIEVTEPEFEIYDAKVLSIPQTRNTSLHAVFLYPLYKDFELLHFEGPVSIIFSDKDDTTHVWKDVNIKYKENPPMYFITSGEDTEMLNARASRRIHVHIRALLQIFNGSDGVLVNVLDISQGGIGFEVDADKVDRNMVGKEGLFYYSDPNDNTLYKLPVIIIRQVQTVNTTYRCGAKFKTISRKFAEYVSKRQGDGFS